MTAIVIAQIEQGQVMNATLATITAARELGEQIDVLVATDMPEAVIKQLASITGLAKILLVRLPANSFISAESWEKILLASTQGYGYVLAPASTFGKNILPRLAAKLNVQPITDVVKIVAKDTFVRPIFAGNAFATVQSLDSIKLLTIRPTAFPLAEIGDSVAEVVELESLPIDERCRLLKMETSESSRPDLGAAKVVISGGRGLQSAENFSLLERLADQLHGAVGASRAAVDAGFVPNHYQVGQTGRVVAPDLYIAVGISGAIQHLAGIKDSKVIVAINKDPEAPIFQIADYGLVGDLFEILPQLEQALKQQGY